jgi:hypothetical protein
MLAREIRVRNPKKKGIYLSAVRSFVFNEVLALRIQRGLWGQTLPGDVLDAAGRPTGPLWGRGRVTTTDQAQALDGWRQSYEQLSAGRFEGHAWQLVMEGGMLLREQTNRHLREQITPPPGHQVQAVPLAVVPGSSFGGRALERESLLVFGADEEHDLVSAGELDLIGLAVDREVLAGLAVGGAASAWALQAGRWPALTLGRWVPVALLGWALLGVAGAPPSRTHGWVTELALALSGQAQPHQRWPRHLLTSVLNQATHYDLLLPQL